MDILRFVLVLRSEEIWLRGYLGNLVKVLVRRGRGDLPLKGDTVPWIGRRLRPAPCGNHEIDYHEYQPRYEDEKANKFETLKNRYLKVKEIFKRHPEFSSCFEALPFNSGYFMCVEIKHKDAEKVRQLLLQKYSIGLIAFNRLLRVAFSSVPIHELETLFDGLYKACQE